MLRNSRLRGTTTTGLLTAMFRRLHSRATSSSSLALVAVLAVVVLTEADRLIAQVLAPDGNTHRVSDTVGPLGLTSLEAWGDWRAAAFDPGGLILVNTLFDLLFIACYYVLGRRLLAAAVPSSALPSPRVIRPSALLNAVLLFDLLEDVSIAVIVLLPSDLTLMVLPAVIAVAATIKWLFALALLGYLLLSRGAGSFVRRFLRNAARALYSQSLGAIVVGSIAVVSLVGADGVLEQVADVYRGVVVLENGSSAIDLAAMGWATLAFALTATSLFVIGRQRAQHYERMAAAVARPPARPSQWLAVAALTAAIAGILALITGGASVDRWVLLAFCGTIAGLALISIVITRLRVVLPPPALPAPRAEWAAHSRTAGDALVTILIAVWGLGPAKSFITPILLFSIGSFDGSPLTAAFTWIIPLTITLAVLGLALALAFRAALPRISAWANAGESAGASSSEQVLRAAIADNPPLTPQAKNRLRSVGVVFVGFAAAVIIVFVTAPSWAQIVGPVATLVSLVGAWATVLGALILRLGDDEPLAVFRLARLRGAPVVAMLVVVPIIASSLVGPAALHSIRMEQSSAPSSRPDLEAGLTSWYNSQRGCAVDVEGTAVYPLVLVAAQGGGIRAATWTVDVMRELPRDGDCASAATFLSSGASGGSIGLASFQNREGDAASASTLAFSGPGALAVDLAGLLGGDLVGAVTGIRVPTALDAQRPWVWNDRTALQEQSWEQTTPQFATRFDSTPSEPTGFVVMNSTDSMSNCKVVISQLDLRVDSAGLPAERQDPRTACNGTDAVLSNTVDLEEQLGDCVYGMNWSTAAELSARFPFVSPSGRISSATLPQCRQGSDMQLVDGSLSDNSGLGTISDVAPALMQLIADRNAAADGEDLPFVVPLVMYLANETGSDVTAPPDATRADILIPAFAIPTAPFALLSSAAWLSRLSASIADACPAAASDSCAVALATVHDRVPSGVAIVSPATEPTVPVPLGWSLSNFSRERLRLEAADQARCSTGSIAPADVLPASSCAAGGGYGRLGDVLELFTDG